MSFKNLARNPLFTILSDVYVSASHWLKVQIQASENFLGLTGGTTTLVADEFTRPADVTAYAAGDAVSATTSDTGTTPLRALTNIARVAQGSGYITRIRLWTPPQRPQWSGTMPR
jgi:hypothetical protein